METKPTERAVKFILNRKYQLRLWGMSKSQWRERISRTWVTCFPGTVDEFILAWEHLEDRKLLER